MSSTAVVSSPWGRRFVRRFIGGFAVILFALLGHQLAQEPDASMITAVSGTVSAAAAIPPAVAGVSPDTTVLPLRAEVSETTPVYGAAHEENRHEPWSELGSICLILAVVLLCATVVAPRRVVLAWWLPRPVRVAAAHLHPVTNSSPTRIALSVSRT